MYDRQLWPTIATYSQENYMANYDIVPEELLGSDMEALLKHA